MYINFNLLREKNIHPTTVIALQMISQNRNEDLSKEIEDFMGAGGLQQRTEEGYVEYVKPKKKSDTLYQLARLSKKGQKLLEDVQTYGVLEEDVKIFDWMKDLYERLGKEIGSETKCKKLIAWFRTASGISKNKLIVLLKTFVEDEDRMEYSKVLQYVFWTQSHRYQKEPALEDSKLWLYYEKYREKFDKLFEQYE